MSDVLETHFHASIVCKSPEERALVASPITAFGPRQVKELRSMIGGDLVSLNSFGVQSPGFSRAFFEPPVESLNRTGVRFAARRTRAGSEAGRDG
jgi:hypothetical protein